jgi:hypothetical protein
MLANNETSVIDEICESRAIRMLVDIRTEFSIITRWLDGGNGQRLRFLRGNFPFLVDLDPLLDLSRQLVETDAGRFEVLLDHRGDGLTAVFGRFDISCCELDVQLFYEGEEPPKLPNLLKRKSSDEIAWGSSGKDARFLSKLRRLLGKANQQDRKIILLMAQKMALR